MSAKRCPSKSHKLLHLDILYTICLQLCRRMMTGDVDLVEHLLFDAEATRGATTSWMKEEFSARR